MGNYIAGIVGTNTFIDQRKVVLLQGEVLIDGFIEDETAITLLVASGGIQLFDLVLRDADGYGLESHNLENT
jgi:hypothetical protein